YAPPLDLPLRFLATVVAILAFLALVYPWHVSLLLGSFYAPHLITFVHVNTLGVIGAAIFGASYQLLPVVLQRPLASVRAARWSWWLFVPGLLTFLGGFSLGMTTAIAAGGALLTAAAALYVGVVLGTLARAPQRDAVFWHLASAVAGLTAALGLALLLALNKRLGVLGAQTLPVLAAHAVLMLGAWVTPMLTGVAYRLVGMFTLSEDRFRPGWAAVELVLTAGGAWTLAGSLLLGLGPGLAHGAGAAGAALWLGGVALFAAQLGHLYRHRRRRTFDVHMPFAIAATAFGLLAGLLVLVGLAGGHPPSHPVWIVAGWWAIAGWAQTAIQGFLYKIGTFLTWLHRYAPLAGRQRVPKLEALYWRPVALAGWACWVTGVALGGVAALIQAAWLALPAALALSAGGAAFVANAARVGRHWRAASPPHQDR
ncbi:MAG: hypothetical protein ACRDJN_00475, partial [Chloroflexota bacterium]